MPKSVFIKLTESEVTSVDDSSPSPHETMAACAGSCVRADLLQRRGGDHGGGGTATTAAAERAVSGVRVEWTESATRANRS